MRAFNLSGPSLSDHSFLDFVENEAVYQAIGELGVDFAQGYAVDKPIPIDDFFATRIPMAQAN